MDTVVQRQVRRGRLARVRQVRMRHVRLETVKWRGRVEEGYLLTLPFLERLLLGDAGGVW